MQNTDQQLTLYTNPMSRGRIARWMLEEVGVPYNVEVLGYGTTMKGSPYLAVNPMGKVPAIVHGDSIVTEVAAICVYLAETFPEAGLAPRPEEKADYYRWLFFAAGPVEAAVTNHSVGWDPSPELARRFGYGSFASAIETLTYSVSRNDFITGPRFTAADVYVGAQVGWGVQFGTMPKNDALVAYAARVHARPAYQRANALDDADMAALKAAR